MMLGDAPCETISSCFKALDMLDGIRFPILAANPRIEGNAKHVKQRCLQEKSEASYHPSHQRRPLCEHFGCNCP